MSNIFTTDRSLDNFLRWAQIWTYRGGNILGEGSFSRKELLSNQNILGSK